MEEALEVEAEAQDGEPDILAGMETHVAPGIVGEDAAIFVVVAAAAAAAAEAGIEIISRET